MRGVLGKGSKMSVSCCRNLGKAIKAVNLHLRRCGGSLFRRIQSNQLSSSSSSMADLKSTFLNVYSILKSDLLHDPSFEFTDESRLWVERVGTLFRSSLRISDPPIRSISFSPFHFFNLIGENADSLFLCRCWTTMFLEVSLAFPQS